MNKRDMNVPISPSTTKAEASFGTSGIEPRPRRNLIILAILLCGCGGKAQQDPTAGLTCDLSDGRRLPVGAIYSDGCNCCLCLANGGNCQAALCRGPADGGQAYWTDTTPCQSDADCAVSMWAGALCIFDQGCSPQQGRCNSNGICPLSEGYARDYCGCDGKTFHVGATPGGEYPNRGYSHLGACP
jgi:hypothetical protein